MADEKKKWQDSYPEGYYDVEILDNTYEEKKTGNIALKVKVSVVKLDKTKNGAPAGNLIMNGHRYVEFYFTDGTIEKTKSFLAEVGFKGSDLRVLDAKHPNHVKLSGKFRASNKPEMYRGENEKYKGKMQDKFDYLPAGGGSN